MAILFLVVLVVFSACDSGARILQLDSGSITEDALRVRIRQTALIQPFSFEAMCAGIGNVSSTEVLNLFERVNVFATRTPVAQADADDERRAARILEEECKSLT